MTRHRLKGERQKASRKALKDPDALARLLNALHRQWNTPDLIAHVADDRDRLLLLKALVSPASESDDHLARRAREILVRQGMDPQHLRKRLEPAAYALGLVSACDVPLDHYEILGVSASATSEEIRAAYRKKAFELHPDTAPGGGGDAAAFVNIQAAYDTLMDPNNRAAYDGCRNRLGMWREEGWRNRPKDEARGTPGRARRTGYRIAATVVVLVIAAWVISILYEQGAILETVETASSPNINIETEPPLKTSKLVDTRVDHGSKRREAAEDSTALPTVPAGRSSESSAIPNIDPAVAHKERRPNQETSDESSQEDANASTQAEKPPAPKSSSPSMAVVESNQANPTDKGVGSDKGKTMAKAAPVSTDEGGRAQPPPLKTSARRVQKMPDRLNQKPREPVNAPEKRVNPSGPTASVTDEGGPVPPRETKPAQAAAVKKESAQTPAVSEKPTKNPQTPSPKAAKPHRRAEPEAPSKEVAKDKPVAVKPGSKDRTNFVRQAKIPESMTFPSERLAAKTQTTPARVDRDQVLAFIRQYTRAYEKGASNTFFSLFTKDATENGKRLEALKPKYREIWDRMKTLNYLIDVLKVNQVPDQGGITVNGRFRLWWETMDQSWGESQGAIHMSLDATGNGLRVKELRYRFD